MTLVEIVVAIVIFFFVLTAIFGLLGATTSMSVFSNERALLVNAMNSYIEEARSMPYTSVGVDVAGAAVPGVLAEETSRTVSGYVVVLRPEVLLVDDPDIDGNSHYKQLTVDGTIARGGEVVYSLSMSTYIRQEAPPGDYTPPTIVFGPGSPPETSPPAVVRGNAVLIDAIAQTTMPGARIVSMAFTVSPGGTYLRDQSGGSALWTLDAPNVSQQFYWDTLAINEDGDLFVVDGEYTITVEAVDSNQKRVFQTRRVVVDNSPPDAPTDLVANALLSGTQVPLTWTTSMDGRSESDHYVLLIGTQAADGSWSQNEITTADPGGLYTLDTVPFSSYRARVAAESAFGERSDWHPSAEAGEEAVAFVTRPLLTGTYDGQYERVRGDKAWDVWLSLSVAPPTFPVDSIEYVLMERIGTGAWTERQRSSTGVFYHDVRVEASNNNPITIDRYYKVVVWYNTVTLGTFVSTESNTLGPMYVPTNGEQTFESPGTW